ncbi:MAG: hypothetical protein Q7J65_01360 [Candidatus Marinimicrobia bacterium]|nr:hypothetical protein [Candidatus Neomarinimicrobiota bacterium]
MKYIEFSHALKSFPCFSVGEIDKQFPGFDRRRLVEWQAKGYIQKLRNRYYCFSDQQKEEHFLYYLANRLYRPSYISLESALAWYGFIPEGVFQTISCSTLKPQRFETPLGLFGYRHLKRTLFFGYRLVPWKTVRFAIAEPEKALIDYLYLNPQIHDDQDFMALRWNIFSINEQIDRQKLNTYGRAINSPVFSRRLALLTGLLDAQIQ